MGDPMTELGKLADEEEVMNQGAVVPTAAPATAPPPSSLTWSPEQQAVFNWVEVGHGSAFVEAVAGSGKTTTLIHACRQMMGSIALAAFNKAVSMEIKEKARDIHNLNVGTFHSFGYSALARGVGRVNLDDRGKPGYIKSNSPKGLGQAVVDLVSYAKQTGAMVLWDVGNDSMWRRLIERHSIIDSVEPIYFDEAARTGVTTDMVDVLIDNARQALQWSLDVHDRGIDFDDMLWVPLVLYPHHIRKYDWVLVDEAQDTNAARREFARLMMHGDTRTLWVGDRHQAIYGFTGADNDAVSRIVEQFECTVLPLSTTYRCSKAATAQAQAFVPHITAHESNLDGQVVNMTMEQFNEVELVPGHDVIVCRFTKPLVQLAMQLTAQGVPAHVEGRDSSTQLMNLVDRFTRGVNGARTINELVGKLNKFKSDIVAAYYASHKRWVVDTTGTAGAVNGSSNSIPTPAICERIDTVVDLCDNCGTVEQLRAMITDMFSPKPGKSVTLCTAHRSKGREWHRVFVLGWGTYMPSPLARQSWEREQEANLCYVTVTRAKSDLVLLPPVVVG